MSIDVSVLLIIIFKYFKPIYKHKLSNLQLFLTIQSKLKHFFKNCNQCVVYEV